MRVFLQMGFERASLGPQQALEEHGEGEKADDERDPAQAVPVGFLGLPAGHRRHEDGG